MTWNPNEDWSHREPEKIWHLVVPYTRGATLDVGAGNTRWFSHWVTLDAGTDFGGQRVADIMHRGERLPFTDGAFANVFSSHVLEHIDDWVGALEEWWRLVQPAGHMVLYLPHADLYPRVGQPGANPDHRHDFRNEDVLRAMEVIACRTGQGYDVLEDEVRGGGSEYSFFQVFRKRTDGERVYRPWKKPARSALVIRYGGYGDAIMASSVFPGLQAQGYEVTVNTTPRLFEIMQDDPHVAGFIVQDPDQVRNGDLGEYWRRLGERYDHVVNLCECVEGTLLAMPDRMLDSYTDEVRRRMVGQVNYLERHHDIAGVPHEFAPRFYPTPAEVDQVREKFRHAAGRPLVLWCLTGSSVHKAWPHVAQAIVRLLYTTDAHVVLCGDAEARPIEDIVEQSAIDFFGDASRIDRTCGLWPMRATMALAQQAAVVVGPETGVLNAVSHEAVPKVVMLSHSSHANLTKHWVNATVLTPDAARAPCYPCHRLHQDWSRCHQDAATGAALCAAAIPTEAVVDAVRAALPRVGSVLPTPGSVRMFAAG